MAAASLIGGGLVSRRTGRRPSAAAASLSLWLWRWKTSSAQYVAGRAMDPSFEVVMEGYKHFLKVVAVQDLILASPSRSLPLPILSSAAPRLGLRRGASAFVHTFPHIFSVHLEDTESPSGRPLLVRLTPAALHIARLESSAASPEASVSRLVRLLSMSPSRSLPLRAIFKVWRELGLPDDFEDSVLARNPHIFSLRDNPKERNTHILELLQLVPPHSLVPAVDLWRRHHRRAPLAASEGGDDMLLDTAAAISSSSFAFKQGFPPGMRLTKNFREKLKEWQRRPYAGPYELATGPLSASARRKPGWVASAAAMEKRAVGVAHEFLSLTVEGMVEVEKISQFRKWFGIDMNIRDLFLDHPGMFYLSTKGKRHTVFLREAYEKGRLVQNNAIYDARMKLLHLVLLRRRGFTPSHVSA